jgi:DNA-binding response OmpR family regulator
MILRAFIFEPDEIVREFLQLVLDRRGYEVFAFERAGVCAMAHEARCPSPPGRPCADIIIADVNRYGFPSFQILQHIAHGNCKVPNIAVMSGNWLDMHRGYARTFDCQIFDKPFYASALRSWLDECEQRIDPDRNLYDGFWADSCVRRNP